MQFNIHFPIRMLKMIYRWYKDFFDSLQVETLKQILIS